MTAVAGPAHNDDVPTFEELLAHPALQFDLDNELLPHLLSFAPPQSALPRRPWLYDAARMPSTTAAAPAADRAPWLRDEPCPLCQGPCTEPTT